MEGIAGFRAEGGRCVDLTNGQEPQDFTYACQERRYDIYLRFAISVRVQYRFFDWFRYLCRLVRILVFYQAFDERAGRYRFQFDGSYCDLYHAYDAGDSLYRLQDVQGQDCNCIARRRRAVLAAFQDVYRRRRDAQGTYGSQEDLGGLGYQAGCVAHDITNAYRLAIDVAAFGSRAARMRQVRRRLANFFSDRAFFLAGLTRWLHVFFFLQVILEVCGDDPVGVSRSPFNDDYVGFFQIARGGRVYGFVYRGLIDDFWDAFFHAFKGSGTLAVYLHAHGSEIGWVGRECLVLCVGSMKYIVSHHGDARCYGVGVTVQNVFCPRLTVVVVFGADKLFPKMRS